MKCPKCEFKNEENANFCAECGEKIALDNLVIEKQDEVISTPLEPLYQLYGQNNNTSKSTGKTTAALVLGIIACSLSVICCCFMYIEIVVVVLAVISLALVIADWGNHDGKTVASLILSIIALVIATFFIIVSIAGAEQIDDIINSILEQAGGEYTCYIFNLFKI